MQKLGWYLLVTLLFISLASASFISLTTQITVNNSSSNESNILLNIVNNGDEPAMAVQPEIEFNNNTFSGQVLSSLEPKKSYSWNIPIKTRISIPGRYPLILKTRYFDLNNYAFSSISPTYLPVQEDTTPTVFGTLNSIEMTETGKLDMQLINLDDKQKNVEVRLYIPRELTADKEILDVTMDPKSKKDFEFNIERFSALSGSNYAVAAIIEYKENNKHYSNILRGSIKLVESTPSITSPITIIIVILIIIVFVISIILLERRRKKKALKNEQPN